MAGGFDVMVWIYLWCKGMRQCDLQATYTPYMYEVTRPPSCRATCVQIFVFPRIYNLQSLEFAFKGSGHFC
jgi:hypothetical protein